METVEGSPFLPNAAKPGRFFIYFPDLRLREKGGLLMKYGRVNRINKALSTKNVSTLTCLEPL